MEMFVARELRPFFAKNAHSLRTSCAANWRYAARFGGGHSAAKLGEIAYFFDSFGQFATRTSKGVAWCLLNSLAELSCPISRSLPAAMTWRSSFAKGGR
jgi:hypothetical protein